MPRLHIDNNQRRELKRCEEFAKTERRGAALARPPLGLFLSLDCLKERLKKEGNETVTNCHGLKMTAADDKQWLIGVDGMKFRSIQRAVRAELI